MNFNFKIAFLFIVGILIHSKSFSQDNYIEGHLISLKGDTIQGYVDYGNWEKNPNTVSFKKNLNDASTIYKPSDIKSFYVSNEVYIGAEVKVEVSPYQLYQLNGDARFKYDTITCFLQTMIHGEKGLYFYKTQIGKEYFYIKEGSDYSLLEQKKYIKIQKGKRIVFENKKYVGQLALYLKDCPQVQKKVNTLEYTKKSFEKLFQSYYILSQKAIKFEHKAERITTEIGILFGVSFSTIDFGGSGVHYLIKTNYDKSTTPSVGFFFDFILPRNKGKISIYNELMMSSYKVSGTYNDFESDSRYSIYNSEIGATYLKLNNMFRYKQPIGNAFIYVNAGVSNGFVLNETNKLMKKTVLSTFENIDYKKALSETKKHEIGFITGLGAMYKQYSFELRYEKANGISEFKTLSSSTSRIHLLIGYRF